jgi:hypothetical protein
MHILLPDSRIYNTGLPMSAAPAEAVTGITSGGREILYDIVNMTPTTIQKAIPREATSHSLRTRPDIGIASDPNLAQPAPAH